MMQPVNKLYKKSCDSRLEDDIISRNCLVTCSEFNSAYLQTAHSKPRSVVNRETSTSSSCPLPLSILKSIPHVVMRTISDEEAKRAKRKIHGVKNGTGVSHKKKPQRSDENIYVRHGNECFGSSGSLLSHNATVLSIDADNKYCGSPAGCQHILFTQAS